MSKHTLGPWSGGVREIRGPNNETIAGLSGYKHQVESEANARLIAAAPEMLAELEFACRYFRETYIVTEDSRHEPEYQMWQGFERMIKKARGEGAK